MTRTCTRCRRPFAPADLVRAESRNMEFERKAAGLEGVRFLYYHCPACEVDDIFVDILPVEGEPAGDYHARRAVMEETVRSLHTDAAAAAAAVDAVVVPVRQPAGAP